MIVSVPVFFARGVREGFLLSRFSSPRPYIVRRSWNRDTSGKRNNGKCARRALVLYVKLKARGTFWMFEIFLVLPTNRQESVFEIAKTSLCRTQRYNSGDRSPTGKQYKWASVFDWSKCQVERKSKIYGNRRQHPSRKDIRAATECWPLYPLQCECDCKKISDIDVTKG